MPRKPALHDADDLLMPALDRAIAAIDPPESDAALVALARVLAHSVDRMSNDERARMIGQTAPSVLKVLVELEARAEKRRMPAERPPGKLEQLRAAHAATIARRR
jgi:hypothetical protein